ncbi:MAG TPA: hypothetical protein VMV04_19670 [Thermodesulfobacteriota bacterium]|nr:hypothetical protein [Thermodesulfobacteriota bacterium]
MKKILLVSVFLIPVMFFSPRISIGGEPPPGFTIGGPVIVGMLTLENERDDAGEPTGWMTVTFRGMCKVEYVKKKLCYFPLQIPFADITKENLLYYVLQYEGPSDCYSECGGEDIIITKVLKFKNAGDRIYAEVVFRFLIPI